MQIFPPQTNALFSLLAHLSLETAHLVPLGINLFLMVVSLCMLALILSWYQSIGLIEITLLVSFLNTGFSRGNVRGGQTSLLICVLLLATFILATRGRKALAGLLLGAVTFKPTFLPLYVGYYLLRRSCRLVTVCVLAAGLFTSLPLLLTQRPLVETMASWLRILLTLAQAANSVNDPSPFVPYSAFLLNIAPLTYRVLNVQSDVTTVISWLVVLILCGCIIYLILHSQLSEKGNLLDFGLVSALSLLSIYHRSYDIFLLFPGLLYIYIHALSTSNKAVQRNWGGFLVIIILLISLPGDLSVRLSNVYPALLDNYLWRVIAPFQAWAGVAVFGALLWLKACQIALHESQVRL